MQYKSLVQNNCDCFLFVCLFVCLLVGWFVLVVFIFNLSSLFETQLYPFLHAGLHEKARVCVYVSLLQVRDKGWCGQVCRAVWQQNRYNPPSLPLSLSPSLSPSLLLSLPPSFPLSLLSSLLVLNISFVRTHTWEDHCVLHMSDHNRAHLSVHTWHRQWYTIWYNGYST